MIVLFERGMSGGDVRKFNIQKEQFQDQKRTISRPKTKDFPEDFHLPF
jgi:hypothetical protein